VNHNLSCFLLAISTGCVVAQEEAAARTANFVIPAGEIEVHDLINHAAGYLEWNILVDPAELKHCTDPIKLQHRIEVDRNGCEDVVTTLLHTEGIVVVALDQSKHLYEALAADGPRSRDCFASAPQKSVEAILQRPSLRMPVTTVVQLEHISATIASNSMRPYFATTMQRLTVGGTSDGQSLALTGMQHTVASAIALLKRLDVEPKGPDLQESSDAGRPKASVGAPTWTDIEKLQARIKKLEKALAALQRK